MLSIFGCDGSRKLVGSRWIPAFAGMTVGRWIPAPAFAGVTFFRGNDGGQMDSRFRGNDGGQMDSRPRFRAGDVLSRE